MDRPPGVVVVGTGVMGPAHTEALRRLGLTVVGILGSSPEKSRRAAAALGLVKGYASFDEVLADPEVQSVHLATPNRLHYGMAKAALLAGKHVLCEKPLAMTSVESAELVELARNSNVAAGVNYNMRFYPLCLETRERIRRGDLGEIYSVQGSYVQDWLLYPTDYNWRVLAEEGGALRAVADIGTHWLDLVQSVTGRAAEAAFADLHTVHSIRRRPRGEVETFSGKVDRPDATDPIAIATEDLGAILLRFQGGARGSLFVSQTTAGRKNCLRFEIAGANGAVAWNSEAPNELWLGHRDQPNELLLKDPGLLSPAIRPYVGYPGGHNEGYPDSFKQCFRAFYDYIRAGDFSAPKPFPTFDDGHREIRLCDAILASHRQQAWVTLAT
jgi:predicted dehydrogenase